MSKRQFNIATRKVVIRNRDSLSDSILVRECSLCTLISYIKRDRAVKSGCWPINLLPWELCKLKLILKYQLVHAFVENEIRCGYYNSTTNHRKSYL